MASIDFTLNNLNIIVAGTNGTIDTITYTNLDPVNYVFRLENRHTKRVSVVVCHANTPNPTTIDGFFRTATDETNVSFLGAVLPDS